MKFCHGTVSVFVSDVHAIRSEKTENIREVNEIFSFVCLSSLALLLFGCCENGEV